MRHFLTLVVGVVVTVAAASACKVRQSAESRSLETFTPAEAGQASGGDGFPEKRLAKLPTKGAVETTPWPAFFWPLTRGGIASHYLGQQLTPVDKLAAAFPDDAAVQRYAEDTRKEAKAWMSPSPLNDGQPEWAGICHGSVVASANFPEPTQPVEVNGIVFLPFEIKGLLSHLAARATAAGKPGIFAGDRNMQGSSRDSFDQMGRPINAKARDVNPGLFHLVLSNFVGNGALRPTKIAADGDIADRVLNFPIVAYEFKVSPLSITDGARRYRDLFDISEVDGALAYRHSSREGQAGKEIDLYEVKAQVTFSESLRILERHPKLDEKATFTWGYMYILEVSRATGAIVGGEWLGVSRRDHPDFLWGMSDSAAEIKADVDKVGLGAIGARVYDLAARSAGVVGGIADQAVVQGAGQSVDQSTDQTAQRTGSTSDQLSPTAAAVWERAKAHRDMVIGYRLMAYP